jgi:hypothetical protein
MPQRASMRRKMKICLLLLVCMACGVPAEASGQLRFAMERGAVYQTAEVFSQPRDGGSLSKRTVLSERALAVLRQDDSAPVLGPLLGGIAGGGAALLLWKEGCKHSDCMISPAPVIIGAAAVGALLGALVELGVRSP